jgi:hypothetical protein
LADREVATPTTSARFVVPWGTRSPVPDRSASPPDSSDRRILPTGGTVYDSTLGSAAPDADAGARREALIPAGGGALPSRDAADREGIVPVRRPGTAVRGGCDGETTSAEASSRPDRGRDRPGGPARPGAENRVAEDAVRGVPAPEAGRTAARATDQDPPAAVGAPSVVPGLDDVAVVRPAPTEPARRLHDLHTGR